MFGTSAINSRPRCNSKPGMNRLDVRKTYKLYIGGSFVRSESGRYLPAQSAGGARLDNVCHASRKDFRDAVVAGLTPFLGLGQQNRFPPRPNFYSAAANVPATARAIVTEI